MVQGVKSRSVGSPPRRRRLLLRVDVQVPAATPIPRFEADAPSSPSTWNPSARIGATGRSSSRSEWRPSLDAHPSGLTRRSEAGRDGRSGRSRHVTRGAGRALPVVVYLRTRPTSHRTRPDPRWGTPYRGRPPSAPAVGSGRECLALYGSPGGSRVWDASGSAIGVNCSGGRCGIRPRGGSGRRSRQDTSVRVIPGWVCGRKSNAPACPV